jgi:hypothetical protein
MRSRSRAPCLIFAGLGFICFTATVRAAGAGETAWFRQRTQALYDAVASGSRAIWRHTLSRNCVITDEDGHVYSKEAFLQALRPLPKGFSGAIAIRHLTVQTFGDAAVVHFWSDEREEVLGQSLHTTYVETDTYRRASGEWKMVAAQVTVVPANLEPVEVDRSTWKDLVGDYDLGKSQAWRYHVSLHHRSLYWSRKGRDAKLLIPLSPLVFFVRDSIHTIVFVQNRTGQVTAAIELHKYNEITFNRVPDRR